MKVECTKERLLEGIALSERVTNKNHTLQVLGCVLLEARNGTFTVRATNLELGIEVRVPVKILREGVVAVPGSVLYGVVSNIFDGGSITLEVVNDNLSVVTKTSKSVIKTLPYEDFPTIPHVTPERSFTLKSEVLADGIKSVWYSASTSTVKPELASIYLYGQGDKLHFVATDSFRLAEKSISIKGVDDLSVLIPFRNTPEVVRVLESVRGQVEVSIGENQIAFTLEHIYITSRLIDGAFPDYRQIIPKEIATEVIVLKQDVVNVLKKVNVFTDTFHQVTFAVSPSKKQFSVSALNADVGETVESLQASISGEDLEIRFNHRYVSDCMQSITTDSVSLSFSGAGKPLLIRGVSDATFLYLVMPMNK